MREKKGSATRGGVCPLRVLSLLLVVGASAPRDATAGPRRPSAPPARSAADPVAAPHAAGRIIVKLRPAAGVAADREFARRGGLDGAPGLRGLDGLGGRHGLHAVRPLRTGGAGLSALAKRRRADARRARPRDVPVPSFATTYVFELAPGADVEAAAADYRQHPAVEWAEPDRVRSVSLVPNDPYLASSGAWGQPFGDLWGLHLIDAPTAWDASRGGGVVVAIVDTGIDLAHPDVAATLWVNAGEVAGNGLDDDGNGFADDVHGWNFVRDAARPHDPSDDHGHGTMVAGIVAATGNNGVGVIGVAWQGRVMALKGLSAEGAGYDSDLAAAILYAAENGAGVINASWGGLGGTRLVAEAIDAVTADGVVFVAAAGNESADISGTTAYPEFYPANAPRAIAVAASDHQDQPAPFSNFGHRLDLTAPGGGDTVPAGRSPERSVLSLLSSRSVAAMTGGGSLIVGQRYVRQAGTSFAAPFVAGTAALLVAARPDLDVEQMRQALRVGADDVGPAGFDDQAGAGRLNAARALQVAEPLAARILAAEPVAEGGVDTLVVRGSVYGPGLASYRLEAAADLGDPVWTPVAGPFTAPVVNGELGRVTAGPEVVNGAVLLRLVASADDGVFEDRFLAPVVRARITSPRGDGQTTSYMFGAGGGPIEIRGSVAVPGLVRYAITYRTRYKSAAAVDGGTAGAYSSETTAGIVLANGGTAPVSDGVLATFDPSVLPGPSEVYMRLVVETTHTTYSPTVFDANGSVRVVVDTSVRPGWPRKTRGLRNTGPVLADLDGDGRTEVLALGWDLELLHTPLYVFEPDGSDRPGWPQLVAATPGEPPFIGEDAQGAPSAADLDGDGRMEIVVAKGDAVYVFHDDGRPAAGWPRRFAGATSRRSALVDLDGDERPEIVIATGVGAGGSVRVGPAVAAVHALRLDGTELAGFPAPLATGGFPGAAVAVGDVTGDGRPEIAVTVLESFGSIKGKEETKRTIHLELLDAAGRPAWPRRRKLDRMFVALTSLGAALANEVVPSPIMADADGDGVLDLVVNSRRSARRLHTVSGAGRPRRLRLPKPPAEAVRPRDVYSLYAQAPVVAGDLDGDGVPELSVTGHYEAPCGATCPYYDGSGDVVQLSYLHAGSASAPKWSELPALPRLIPRTQPHLGGAAAIADLDGDGAPDLTFVPARHNVHPVSMTSAFRTDGTWIAGFPKAGRGGSNSAFSSPAVGDLDGDGRVELVVMEGSGLVIVWDTPGQAHAGALQWPMTGHDAQGTNALPVVR